MNSRHAGDICPKDAGPAADKAQARRAALAISQSTSQEGALLSTDGPPGNEPWRQRRAVCGARAGDR